VYCRVNMTVSSLYDGAASGEAVRSNASSQAFRHTTRGQLNAAFWNITYIYNGVSYEKLPIRCNFHLYRNVLTGYKKEFLRDSTSIRMPVLLMRSFREAVQLYRDNNIRFFFYHLNRVCRNCEPVFHVVCSLVWVTALYSRAVCSSVARIYV